MDSDSKPTTNLAPPLVAVVDDDASFLRSVGRLLRSMGYAVKTFGSARQFLGSLPRDTPRCLILDVHMPEMTGLQLCDQLTVLGYCLPVIFLTAYDTPQTREYAQRLGSHGMLLKPFDMRQLLDALTEALNNQKRLPGHLPTPPVPTPDKHSDFKRQYPQS